MQSLVSLVRPAAFPALAVILLPVVMVVTIAFGESGTFAFPPPAFSLRWFWSFLGSRAFTDSLFRVTIPLSLSAAGIATILGLLAAIGLVRLNFAGKRYLESLFVVPLVFPHIVLGVGLLLLCIRLERDPSLALLGAGYVLIGVPFVIRTVVAGLAQIDQRTEEAALTLGANRVTAFCLVTLPLLKTSIVSGCLFAFIAAFGEINLALFLSTAEATTLPMQILAQMQYTGDPTIAAAATVQVLVISILLWIIQWFSGGIRRNTGS